MSIQVDVNEGSQQSGREALDELREAGALDALFAKIDAGELQPSVTCRMHPHAGRYWDNDLIPRDTPTDQRPSGNGIGITALPAGTAMVISTPSL